MSNKTKLVVVKTKAGFSPFTEPDWDIFERIPVRQKPLTVYAHQARNPEHHCKLWALANKVAENDRDFEDAEEAIRWAKLNIPGMHHSYTMYDDRLVVQVESINFESMDQIHFSRFYDRALFLWGQRLGVAPETLLDEVRKTYPQTEFPRYGHGRMAA